MEKVEMKGIKAIFRVILVGVMLLMGASAWAKEEEKVHHIVEVRASFPGGPQKQIEYTEKHLKYPKECAGTGAEGRMIVSFIVEKNGKLSNVVVETKMNEYLDAEAVRFVKGMPKWTPGKIGGKKVRTYNSMMLYFTPTE